MGKIFIIPRSNKFYSLAPETVFTVYINEGEKKIDNLLPQKDYGKLYNKVAFYVICRQDKKDKVRQEFINHISEKPFLAVGEDGSIIGVGRCLPPGANGMKLG